MAEDEPTHQPARVIVGHCPKCAEVVVLFNNHEVWSPVVCKCGWGGGTNEVRHYTRLEREGVVIDEYSPSRRGFVRGA